MNNKKLIRSIYDIGLIKFGTFTFKSGIVSPNYLDHRILVSYPNVLKQIAKAYASVLKDIMFDRMVAIPYAAMPIVGAISLENGKPWIYTRKETKGYGTNKLIEGIYKRGETLVLIDDVITTGGSKFESIDKLKTEGLTVKDIVVFIDREQGGREEVEKRGMRLHSVLKLTEVFTVLRDEGVLNDAQYNENVHSLIHTQTA